MNNRGFTLIELLVVIAIIGLLGAVATISLTGTIKETNETSCNEFVKRIEDSACVYYSLSKDDLVCNSNDCNPIKLEVLVNEGLISDKKDACTGKDLNLNATISVRVNNGEKECTYNGVRVYER